MHALKTIRAKTWRLVTLAPAAILLAVLLVPTAMALVSTNEGFRSNGDLIAGWYWLRDRGLDHYAEYTFPNPPKQGDILLDINALATDHVNGGPGVDAVFNLLVGFPGARNMGGVFHRIRVTLPNVSPPSDPVGYMTSGKIRLERKILDRVIPASGELFIRIVRARSQDPHVAFRSDSVRLHNSGGSAGDQSDGREARARDHLRQQLSDYAPASHPIRQPANRNRTREGICRHRRLRLRQISFESVQANG